MFNSNQELFALTGSPGGSRIIDYTAKSLLHLIDWQHSPETTVNAPHIIARNNQVLELEENRFDKKTNLALKLLGHKVQQQAQSSGLHIIKVINETNHNGTRKATLMGAADPRREGVPTGVKETRVKAVATQTSTPLNTASTTSIVVPQ